MMQQLGADIVVLRTGVGEKPVAQASQGRGGCPATTAWVDVVDGIVSAMVPVSTSGIESRLSAVTKFHTA